MLVLTRRVGESIIIGDNIELFIVEILPYRARIGVKAPDRVPVDREEIRALKAMEDERRRVAASRPRPDEGDD